MRASLVAIDVERWCVQCAACCQFAGAVRGLTSDPKFSVERVPNLTRYSYHVDTRFDEKRGTGHRLELRKCDLTFRKQESGVR